MNPINSVPKKIVIPESAWKSFLKENETKYGIKWIVKRSKSSPTTTPHSETTSETPNEEGQSLKKRRRLFDYIWYSNYHCHRSGSKRDKVAEGILVRGGVSGKPRNQKKPSKKIMCDAKLKVIAYKNNPGFVEFIYTGEHNHSGENEALNLLPNLQFAINNYSQNPWTLNEDQLKILQCSVDIIVNVLQHSPVDISNTNLYLNNISE